MSCVPFVKYAQNHDPQQDEVFNEVDHNTPLELGRLGDATCAELGGPLGLTLNSVLISANETWEGLKKRDPCHGCGSTDQNY